RRVLFRLVAGFSAFADELRQFGEPRHAPALGAEPALVTDVGQQTGAEVGPPRVSTLRGKRVTATHHESNSGAKKPADVNSAKTEATQLERGETDNNTPNSQLPSIPTLRIDRRAPRCEDIYVYIVSDWVDGEAMATIATGPNSRGYPKRIGARVGEYEVVAIGPTTFGNGPAVWLAQGDEVCRAM